MGIEYVPYDKMRTRTEYVPYDKTVTINRAPTDESIGLLNEFTKKAKNNIIHTVHIQENYLRAIGIYYYDDIVNNRTHFHLKFNLNGKRISY
jgi:hypothetical protein